MQRKTIHYEFPILSIEDIVANANEMGGDVDEKHLINPTCEVIWPLYELMAQWVLTISREEFQQIAFDKWIKLKYPEMHEESIACFASWNTIRQLMFAAGVVDISFRDLTIKPDSSRTIRFLSGLINFARYRKEREDRLAELQDESLPEVRQQLEESIERAKHEIASIEAEREREIPAVLSLEAENMSLELELKTLNKTQGVYQLEIRTLKQELASITDAISGQNYMLQQAKQEASDLRGQIVESPEKYERAIEETKAALVSSEAATEEVRTRLHRWKQKHESYAKSMKAVQKMLGLSEEDVKQKLLTLKAASKEAKILKAKLKADEEEDRLRNIKLAELRVKSQNCQDLIDKEDLRALESFKEEEKKLQDVNAKLATTLMYQQVGRSSISKKKAQVQFLVSQDADVLKTKEDLIQNCEEEIAGIQELVLEYYRSLLSCTGPIPQLAG